jgi:hypothetical protein
MVTKSGMPSQDMNDPVAGYQKIYRIISKDKGYE